MDQLGVARRSIGGGCDIFVSALRSSGSKLPRHKFLTGHRFFLATGLVVGAASRPSGDKSLATNGSGGFPADEKKDLEFQGLSLRWCPEGDSNSHSFRKRILNPPRLPIPPSGLNGGEV